MELGPEQAGELAAIALGHVTREYPNLIAHVLSGPEDARTPRALHPAFYGSYDWHSSVHTHWLLAFLLRLFPDLPEADRIRAVLDAHLTPAAIAAECAYFERPGARGFERPYGWAWLLALSAELRQCPDRRWSDALAPLTALIVGRVHAFLPISRYPVRTGSHPNTAFLLALAAGYAEVAGDTALLAALREAFARWYGQDRDCPAWEPGGDDFLSPALIEAECARRLLPSREFRLWLAAFLPRLAFREPETLFIPATVGDRSDGKIAHLDGLNLTRAWCWRSLSRALDAGTPERRAADSAAADHLGAGLPHLTRHYMGEHWLASFAALALAA